MCVSHQITSVVGNIYLYLACQLEINYIINNNVIEYAHYTYPELQNIVWEKFTKEIILICITKNLRNNENTEVILHSKPKENKFMTLPTNAITT